MKKFLRSPLLTLLLFIAATVLLVAGGIGTTQAVISDYSATYRTEMQFKNIGVTLLESTKPDMSDPKRISFRSYGSGTSGTWAEDHTGGLMKDMVKDAGDKELLIGKAYPFFLSVQNSGQVNEYVRVTLYKYWVDQNGKKLEFNAETNGQISGEGVSKAVKYDPSLIDITLFGGGLWVEDEDAKTVERQVFYYTPQLNIGDTTAEPLTSAVAIDSSIKDIVKVENGVYKYAYDDLGFVIEVQVDAVQAKHSDQSIPSAWGVQR